MRICAKRLAGLVILMPSALLAQISPPTLINPLFPTFNERIADFKLIPPAAFKGHELPFSQHLPSIISRNNKKVVAGGSPIDAAYRYNLPVVKPGKTSKILVARLDPDHPYSYRMPVKKNESRDK